MKIIWKNISKKITKNVRIGANSIPIPPSVTSLIEYMTALPTFSKLAMGVSYLSDSKTGDYPIRMTGQNCLNNISSNSLTASSNFINGNKWAFEMYIESRDVASGLYDCMVGLSTGGTNYRIGLKDNATPVFHTRKFTTHNGDGAVDTSVITGGVLRVVSNSATIKLVKDGETFDTATSADIFTLDLVGNYGALTRGIISKIPYFKVWDLSAKSQAEIDLVDFDTEAPTNHFQFNKYDAATSPATAVFYDLMGTGLTLTSSSVLSTRFSTCIGLSWNFEKGFAVITATGSTVKYPVLNDGSIPAELVGNEAGYVLYPALNDKSEQKGEAIATAYYRAIDTDNVIFTSGGIPIALDFTSFPTASYINKSITSSAYDYIKIIEV